MRKVVQQRLNNQGSEANKVKKTVVPEENEPSNMTSPLPTEYMPAEAPTDAQNEINHPPLPNQSHREED